MCCSELSAPHQRMFLGSSSSHLVEMNLVCFPNLAYPAMKTVKEIFLPNRQPVSLTYDPFPSLVADDNLHLQGNNCYFMHLSCDCSCGTICSSGYLVLCDTQTNGGS